MLRVLHTFKYHIFLEQLQQLENQPNVIIPREKNSYHFDMKTGHLIVSSSNSYNTKPTLTRNIKLLFEIPNSETQKSLLFGNCKNYLSYKLSIALIQRDQF